MKKWTIVPAILLACFAIISCNKNSNLPKEETAAGLFPPPSLKVKDMTTRNSVTRFYYNNEGGVDSTIELRDTITIRTIMYGKGNYIDSIHKYSQGYLTHRWKDIKYNNAGKLSEFTRWYNESTNNYAKYLLRYDNNGNMVEQKIVTPENTWIQNTFVYNQDHGLTSHSFWLFNWEQEWRIKSDSTLNPFHQMPHLFIIAEGPDDQQLQLNKYNSIEREYIPNSIFVQYFNEYDQYDRLIKRSNSDFVFDWFTLTYY